MSLGRRSIAAEPFRLRFGIKPPAIDIEDPWAEEPQFDPYTFTLLTQAGPVAPARWATFGKLPAKVLWRALRLYGAGRGCLFSRYLPANYLPLELYLYRATRGRAVRL